METAMNYLPESPFFPPSLMSLKFDCSRVRKTNLIVIFCTLLLVCFKFCLSYEERKGSCENVVVQRGRNKPGFHR